jgi:hypothetical protein
MLMEKGDRKYGESAQGAGARAPQPASRPAPGKVTRTSQVSGRGAAVQRAPMAPAPGGTQAPSRSLWDHTMDPSMDAAHRGVTALAERGSAPVPGSDAGQVVQRKSVQKAGEEAAAEAPAAEAPATLDPLTEADVVLSRDPSDTTEDYLSWFRGLVRDALAPWGLPFDPAAVRAAGETVDGKQAPVVALRWDQAWGARPSTPSTEWQFSMEPVEATAAVTAVQALAGWSALAAADRSMLESLIGGESNLLSQTARDHLAGQFATLRTQPAVQQASTLAALISTEEAMPRLADEPVAGILVPYDLEGPTDQPAYPFRGITADAEVWTARYIDNILFPIIAPKAPQAGYHYHTVEQVADVAARVPAEARGVITRILLNPVESPDNDYWEAEYEETDFEAYMTTGAGGVVTIYPDTDALPGEDAMPGSVIHETGHAWSLRTWGRDTTQGKWLEWQAAMDSDKAAVSGYAHESILEDVAETIRVYVGTQGTPTFEEYRSIVPHRFAMLDREYR